MIGTVRLRLQGLRDAFSRFLQRFGAANHHLEEASVIRQRLGRTAAVVVSEGNFADKQRESMARDAERRQRAGNLKTFHMEQSGDRWRAYSARLNKGA